MRSERLRSIFLGAAFTLTGVGVGAVGAALPAIMAQFDLHDRGAGTLMLLAWGGSTAGVLLCRGRVHSSVLRGLVLAALALAAISLWQVRSVLCLFAVYGAGLGIAMTSISVLRVVGMEQADRRCVLNRLNMLWALGACASPALAAQSLRKGSVSGLFGVLAIAFFLAAGAVAFGRSAVASSRFEPTEGKSLLALPPVRLCLFAALAVGAESALGGWLATYAGRTAHGTILTISALTAFWSGLLLSRTLHSSARAERWSIRAHIGVAAAAVGLLIAVPQGGFFMLLSLAAGCGLGPLYPFALSLVLTQYRPRAIFLIAGIGSATVPWLTGMVSGSRGNLRIGLAVPMVTLLALGAVARRTQKQKAAEAV